MNFSKYYILSILILLLSLTAFGQTTKIIGTITDSITGDVMPFVNIQLAGTSVGATTGFDGAYSIETSAKSSSIIVSYIGYKSKTIAIKYGAFQKINISLASSNIELSEVVIVPGENPADVILRKIIANKSLNSKYSLDAYEYKTYNKIQIDANNITDDFKNRRSMKPFQFVFENVDTSSINGKPYLPMLLTETISQIYYKKNPEAKREIILASRASGINNSSVSQFLGSMSQEVNIYDNYIDMFGKNFVSPISDFGLRTYRYYLTDSMNRDGHWCYKLMFKPRRKQELTFTGEIWVADSSFAIKEVDMKMENANLNFVNAMTIKFDYKLVDSTYWMIDYENYVVDFNILEKSKKLTGFYGHKTTYYKDFVINKPEAPEMYKSKVAVETKDDAWDKSNNYWDSTRFTSLNKEETNIYKMVDSVVTMPAFKNIYDIIQVITFGYYSTKYFDFGPVSRTYSFNGIEGSRFRIGGRTSAQWNDKVRLYGHLAYGTKDQAFKYGIGSTFILDNNPRRAVDISYKNDMEQLGASVRALGQDNILSSVFRASPSNSLTMVEQYKFSFEYEYFNGLGNELTFSRRNVFPLQDSKFEIYKNGNNNAPISYNNLITSEISLKTHFAYKELFLTDKFNRTSFGTKYPTIDFWVACGVPNLLSSQFEYTKLQLSIQQWFNIGSIGFSKYIISCGKIFGKLPYPILEVHPGNETFAYDDYAYNRMNYYEFISDEYLMVNYSHNFQGLFLNHIPLIRKLKWREIVYGKALFGMISEENKTYSTFPSNTSFLSEPYYEVGVAVDNIFKIIRIDASWRLSYLNKKDVRPFGIMASLHFDF